MPIESEPVLDGSWVFRCQKPPLWDSLNEESQNLLLSGEALERFFELSSADRQETPPTLSVWNESSTSVPQAWKLRGSNPEIRIVLFLPVDRIRKIQATAIPGFTDCPFLEVVTKPLPLDVGAGAEGHCGIMHLERGNKRQTRELRAKLARVASGANLRMLTGDEMK
jgi:hypothetical protein